MANQVIPIPAPLTLGTNVASGADGVLCGALPRTDPSKFLTEWHSAGCLCITDDGGVYVDDTTDANDAGANDVTPLPAVPVADDAFYVGHATLQFGQVSVNIGQQGVNDHEGTWQYWDGNSWEDLTGVTDNTATAGDALTAAVGIKTVVFTIPGDWAQCPVDNIYGYWVRLNMDVVTAQTTACLITQIWVVVTAGIFADDTADMISAGADDVDLLPTLTAAEDATYWGHATEKFCKVEYTIGQAGVHTLTILYEYWNGSAWATLTGAVDDSAGHTTGTSTYLIQFEPPSDWVANTGGNGPNGEAGFFIRGRVSAYTSTTTQPLGTQGWLRLLKTGSVGIAAPFTGTINGVTMNATTVSGSSADSKFLLINGTTGAFAAFTWTKELESHYAAISLAVTAADKLVLVQIQEDGSTENAGAFFNLQAVAA